MQRKKPLIIIAVVLILGASGAGAWYFGNHRAEDANTLTLYGNVDIREVQLAFNGSERIAQMYAREGDAVKKGQLLAVLDKRSIEKQTRKAEAEVEVARVAARNAASTYERAKALVATHVVSHQQADDAHAASDAARASLRAAEAQLAVARQVLADTELHAPEAGVIQQRILEPGDMASPQRPVYTLALTDPIWVRAYVQERNLGKLKPGMRAQIGTDSYPGKRYSAWVGYISPSAEFTPKSVETTEVRSSLVYQVRVFVCNPQDELRLGMPATVTIALGQPPVTDNEHCRNP